MSDNGPDRVRGDDDSDALSRWSGEDLDALLAQAESLAEEVEQQLGGVPAAAGPDAPLPLAGTLDEAGPAQDGEQKLLQIEALVGTGVAEVGSAAPAALPASPSPTPRKPGADGVQASGESGRPPLTEADHEVAEEEISAALGASPAMPDPPSSPDHALIEPSSWPRRAEPWGAFRRRAVSFLARGLELADRPFAAWPDQRKDLIGYVGLATLVMAGVAWTLAMMRNG